MGEGARVRLMNDPIGRPEAWLDTPNAKIRIPDAEVFGLALQRSETAKDADAARRALKELWGVEVTPPDTEAPARLRITDGDQTDVYELDEVERFHQTLDEEMKEFKQPTAGMYPVIASGRLGALLNRPAEVVLPDPAVVESISEILGNLSGEFQKAVTGSFPLDRSQFKSRMIPATVSRSPRSSNFFGTAKQQPTVVADTAFALRSPLGDEYALQFKLAEQADHSWTLRCTVWRSMFDKHFRGETFDFRGPHLKDLNQSLLFELEHGSFQERLQSSIEQLAQKQVSPTLHTPVEFDFWNPAQLQRMAEFRPLAEGLKEGFEELGRTLFRQPARAVSAGPLKHGEIHKTRWVVEDGGSQYQLTIGAGAGSKGFGINLELARAAYGERSRASTLAGSATTAEGLVDALGRYEINQAKLDLTVLGNVVHSGVKGKLEILRGVETRLGLRPGTLAEVVAELDQAKPRAGDSAPDNWKDLLYQHERETLAEATDAYNTRKNNLQAELEIRMGLARGGLDDFIARMEAAEASMAVGTTVVDWTKTVNAFKDELLEGMRSEHSQQVAKVKATMEAAGEEGRDAALKKAILESHVGEMIRRRLELLRREPVRFDSGSFDDSWQPVS